MSFLVLLLLLLLENGSRWRHGVQRDAWLLAALRRVEARGAADWQLPLLLGLPLLAVGALLWSLAPLAYGWLLLPLHLLLLLWSLGRGDVQRQLAPFRASWQRGDAEAAYLDAQRDLGVQAEDDVGLLREVQGYLLWQAHQGFFAVVCWYALLGPLPALAYRLLALAGERGGGDPLQRRAVQLRHLLDWLPARALVLTLALAGNFVTVGRVLWPRLLDTQAEASRLVVEGGRAAAELGAQPVAGRDGLASLDALQSLLLRAGLVWFSAWALWVLLG